MCCVGGGALVQVQAVGPGDLQKLPEHGHRHPALCGLSGTAVGPKDAEDRANLKYPVILCIST